MATTATTTNGGSAPPHTHDDDSEIAVAAAVADPNALKRKREQETAAEGDDALSLVRVQHIQRDILHVLERHDTTPSFLKHAFTTPASNEPSQKKARLSEPGHESSTIASKLNDSTYTSLQQLAADAKLVSEEIVAGVRAKAVGGRPSVEELKQMHRIHTFETLVQELVETESQYVEAAVKPAVKPKKEEDSSTNGDATEPQLKARVGNVLTLFGNAPTPKQLFSSRQHASAGQQQPFVKAELPVDEMPLPNGITATTIIPTPTDDAKKGPTFEEVFAPPYSLAPLNPPKAYKRPSARDNTLVWEFKDPTQRNKRGGYTVQPLTVGDWLSYGSAAGERPPSPRERRKQRDRALSSGAETMEKAAKDLSDDDLRRQEEALFRRAFSSFAPTHDDSNAILPHQIKNEAWWQKVGNKRFAETFAIDPALLDEDSRGVPAFDAPGSTFKEEEFGRVMDELDQLEDAKPEFESEPAKDKTDIEQVLRDVSELLETLASHQRIRNSTLPTSSTASRTPISPAPVVGKPDEPNDMEISTYNSLRRELAYLILKLPPYAVSKLDGEQLAELRVTELMTFQIKDVKGTMEEDQVTRQAKLAAMATASSIANLARPNSSAGQHYSTTPQRTPAIGQAANTRYGQTFGQRPPTQFPTLQRQPSSQQTYGTPANAPRPAYTQPNQYSRPGAPQQPAYGQSNGQQYYQQRPPPPQQTPSGYGYNQQYQQAPLAQRPTFPPHQPQQYQHRSHAAAATAVGYQTNTPTQQQAYQNRTVSPSKPGYPTPHQPQPIHQAGAQQRSLYQAPVQQPGSGRATPVNYPSQPNTPVNGYPAPHRQPQGIAPRPTSSTPQPPAYQAPPPGHIQQNVTANGSS